MKLCNDLQNENKRTSKQKNIAIYDRSRTLMLFALQSRIFIFCLQVFFNFLVPDHKPDVFNPPQTPSNTTADAIADTLLNGLTRRWDSLYFLFISEHGYFYENTLVFFPFFPFIVKAVSWAFYPMLYIMSPRNVISLAAVVVNTLAFSAAAKQLYKLSYKVLRSEHLAFRTAQLFCVNPASIFFSAAYSESLFSLLTFSGLYYLECSKLFTCAFFFMLCSATRSNATVNTGFILFTFGHRWFMRYFRGQNYKVHTVTNNFMTRLKSTFVFLSEAIYLVLLSTLSIAFFLSHQAMGYMFYCTQMRFQVRSMIPPELIKYASAQGYTLPQAKTPTWCAEELPFHYHSIQQNHWNVGLFQYYELKQIPNFILAAPIIIISLLITLSYLKHNPFQCLFFGFVPQTFAYKKISYRGGCYFKLVDYSPHKWGVYAERCYVYVAHLTFLTVFAVLFMHVQVSTRLLCSSCPIIYWYLAEMSLSEEELMIMEVLQKVKLEGESKRKGQDEGKDGVENKVRDRVKSEGRDSKDKGIDRGKGEGVDSKKSEGKDLSVDGDGNKGGNDGGKVSSIDHGSKRKEGGGGVDGSHPDLKRRKVKTNKVGLSGGDKDGKVNDDEGKASVDDRKVGEDYEKVDEGEKDVNATEPCEDYNGELTMKDIENTDVKLLEEILADGDVLDWNSGCFNKIVSIYFHLYLFVGTALFSNFFPWT